MEEDPSTAAVVVDIETTAEVEEMTVVVIEAVIANTKISGIIFRKKKGSGCGGKISLVLGDRLMVGQWTLNPLI